MGAKPRRRADSCNREPTPVPAGPRVAIYHRVSTLDQDPQLARGELEAWVVRQGGHVALLEEEAGSGAELGERAGDGGA